MICKMFHVRPSQIHGRGCFAGVTLLPGTVVPVPTREIVEKDATHHTLYTEDGCFEPYSPFAFLNHSDYSNAELFWDEDYGHFALAILRVVGNGHEITIDYGPDYDFEV